MTVSLGWFYWTIILLSLLGALCGWLFAHTDQGIGWGIVAGIAFATWLSLKKLAQILYPDSFTTYAYDEEAEIVEKETCVLALTIPERGTIQIHGLSEDEWVDLANRVIDRGYEFTTRSGLGDYYDRTRGKLLGAGVLVENSKGGVDVSDHIGKHFFAQLAKGDYKILNILPHSERDSV